jgi:signal transduction histidine kinase/DNA-binding response OmpR family regulator
LARFQPETGAVSNYYRSDGLLDNQFYWSASDQGPDGKLYFGGVSGLSFFDPQAIQPFPFSPEVVITDFKVLNQSLAVGEKRHGQVALTRSSALADTVQLSYQDNVFSIEFAALAYYLPERLTYQYRIEGVDPDWVEVPAERHFANYTNLSGGSYHFQVRALNEDRMVSANTASLWVLVKPPFWETGWFTGLMIALGVVLVMAYIRLRTRYLHQQKDKLEQEVMRRTHQIEEQNAKLEKQKVDLIELNEQVKMVNQLRLRFFTNISHEFRTPLTLIIDPVLDLLEKHAGDSPTGRTLRIVHRNAQRLLHLINQLMHFRRLESGKLKVRAGAADLKTFVQEVFDSFSHLAEQRQIAYRLEVVGKPEGPTFFDAEKIENVLFNLLGNAFKYSSKQGSIRLRLCFLEKGRARFLVIDSGPGIPADQQAHIFDHFYRVENQANRKLHGSGIGLALCKELVQSMHGKIWVDSEVGQGSCFGFELPYAAEAFAENEIVDSPQPYYSNLSTQVNLAQEELQIQEEPEAPVEAQDAQKPLLLIAEDNYDLRSFLSQSLQGQYRILGADNGKEALELARKYTPQLIVSDIMMPVMDGLELCSHLKGNVQTSHIPVILLTARDAVEHWVEGLETGADDYIPKPFNLKILQTRIDNLIASRQQLKLIFTKGQMPMVKEVTSNSLDEEFLQKVYDQLEARATEPDFSHDELADTLCMSRSLLYKKLKALTGMTVTEFINSHRLRLASELLHGENLTVSEVAFRCGFNDPKYFSRVFRKYYGMSPSEYAQTPLESAQ